MMLLTPHSDVFDPLPLFGSNAKRFPSAGGVMTDCGLWC